MKVVFGFRITPRKYASRSTSGLSTASVDRLKARLSQIETADAALREAIESILKQKCVPPLEAGTMGSWLASLREWVSKRGSL